MRAWLPAFVDHRAFDHPTAKDGSGPSSLLVYGFHLNDFIDRVHRATATPAHVAARPLVLVDVEADHFVAWLHHADLRIAVLVDANLSEAWMPNANLAAAYLKDANLSGADLTTARNLTQSQLDEACGDEKTKLPVGRTIKPCPPEE